MGRGLYGHVRDERQLRQQGRDLEPDLAGGVPGELGAIVSGLLLRGIEPVLMTEPRWADDAPVNGLGESPNIRLAPYMEACRTVATKCRVPLVDHFARWTEARSGASGSVTGRPTAATRIRGATMSWPRPCCPRCAKRSACTAGRPFTTRVETVLTHDDGEFLWYHPRARLFRRSRAGMDPEVLITLQKHLKTSDHYSGLSVLGSARRGTDAGGPRPVAELDWVHEPGGVNVAVADVTPMFHSLSGKVLAVGAQVRYSPPASSSRIAPGLTRQHMPCLTRNTGTGRAGGGSRCLRTNRSTSREALCAQFVMEADGSVLLPFYISRSAEVPFSVTVVRCKFDSDVLTYREHGDVLALNAARGLYEPSLIRLDNHYFLTIRNDHKAYVTVSGDGLHWRPVKPWTFDDGEDLGSYNTQQHWLAHGDGLFLIYTRRGANNDHVMRHRAPLFIAQVDPQWLRVIRATERVLVPERGAELGNFGAVAIAERESWVTVAEGVWSDEARRRGAKGAVFVARVVWEDVAP